VYRIEGNKVGKELPKGFTLKEYLLNRRANHPENMAIILHELITKQILVDIPIEEAIRELISVGHVT